MITEVFQSRQDRLATAINSALEKLHGAVPMVLPRRDAAIVARCVERIQGNYDVSRARRDTDHALDLLHIAYNTTPRKHSGIRARISGLMNSLIRAQQESALVMDKAVRTAADINGMLEDTFPDWLDIRESAAGGTAEPAQVEELRTFVRQDLTTVARRVQARATEIQTGLTAIANMYGRIIVDAERATRDSEVALGDDIKEREALQREINRNDAQRRKLAALMADLREEVGKFEANARQFEARANTAEERAFVVSILRAAATVVSSVVAPVAMLATGGMLGAATRSTGISVPAPARAGSATDGAAQAQRSQEASVHDMQMRMLDRAEAFEKERRIQSAELVRINVLLTGQQTQEETLQLAVQSLSLSISALKRMREIVQELAFFFQSFANLMGAVASDASLQLELFELAESGTLRADRLRNLVRSTDIFFLQQVAEWHAAGRVSSLFNQSFADGWTRLNKLIGASLAGDALKAYLTEAASRLTQISQERERRADATLADLQLYRERLIARQQSEVA